MKFNNLSWPTFVEAHSPKLSELCATLDICNGKECQEKLVHGLNPSHYKEPFLF